MKLFLAELRQIFSAGFLLAAALAGAVYACVLIVHSDNMLQTYLSSSSGPIASNTDIEKRLADSVLEDGRTAVTENDLEALSEDVAITKELDAFFRKTEAFHPYGVASLEDYKQLEKDWSEASVKETSGAPDDPALSSLSERLEKVQEIIASSGKEYEIQNGIFIENILDSIRDEYAGRHEPSSYVKGLYTSEEQKARLQEIYSGPMDSPAFSMLQVALTTGLVMPFTLFSCFLFSFLFVPAVWKNRSRNIYYLQYSSAAGRNVLRAQYLAALAACLLLLTIFLIPVLCLMAQYGILRYFPLPVSGFLSGTYLWFDMNIGTYFSLMVLLTYVLCAGLSLLSMCISRLCRNFVACVACSLPLFAAVVAIGEQIFNATLSLYSPKLTETYLTGFLLFLGIAGAAFLSHREKTLDIA